MFELKTYYAAPTLDEADDCLHRDKKNVILGGLLWMRMGSRQYHTGIDLSGLGLDRIEDKGSCVDIGAMTCLRQIETSTLLADHFGPVLRDAVASIVGVQFRNLATVGGSVFSRFSFSDLITALMVLDTRVYLHRAGAVPLADFLETSPGRDILVKLSIPKRAMKTSYQSVRKTATDFPVLAGAFARTGDGWRIALGARPSRARLAPDAAGLLTEAPGQEEIDAACATLIRELSFGTNQRGGKAYREHLAKILVKRGIRAICN